MKACFQTSPLRPSMAFITGLFLSARRTEKIERLTLALFLELSQSQFSTINIRSVPVYVGGNFRNYLAIVPST